jgi:hypothetical protein
MPLKTIVCPISEPEKFSEAVENAMQKVQEEFLFFNRKHQGKVAEVSRSVTFHATATDLICIIYYSWAVADQSSLVVPSSLPSGPRRVQ